ncbi:hypothetical protein GA0061099_10396 [Bradyrhizobium yuanmingense]|uniref:Uncharacterized protein n=1 Tax=Bradyrhizobium yuanmingense TaxID=108015 RepID=A0A1C3XKZ6_9BRAD|nr:hypothetical protein [Bradyrhizobium yuanmingense]TWI18995.1 hypothetical protein IQ15_07021 [Bradyrhizobium yuanmingense]SCB52726.1 hypothetical protein GA0061099_10396 [Bradyrhizobium yuanmingense]
MAVLDIGGTRVSVDDSFLKLAPEQQHATVEEIAKSLPKAVPAQPSVGVGEDLAKSAASAPGRAAGSLLGLPGDLYHLGLRALGDNLTPRSDYGSEAIRESLGSSYEAKTEPGRLLQKAADFAPALIGGPEALAVKALTRVAAPAVASEAGRAVAGPYGEVAGALLGAGGATAAARKFQQMGAARSAANAIPSTEDILTTARGQFKAAEDMNVVVKPDFTSNAANDMRSALRGFDPEGQAPVFKAVDRLEALGASAPGLPPVAVPMNEIELIRKQLTNLKMSSDAPTREAARKALETLVGSQKGLTAADVVAGDAALYSKTVQDAVGNYAAGKRSNTVMGKAALGDLNAATAGSGANEDNALRQAIKQLVRPVNNDIVPKAQRLGFNQSEIEAMNQVARGTPVGNVARYIGKLAPTGSVSGVLSAGAGYGAAGPMGAVALPAVGYLAKKIGDMSTKSAVKSLDFLVRSRSPLAQQVAAQLPHVVAQLPTKSQRILQTLAVAAPPIRQQIGQPVGQPVAQ